MKITVKRAALFLIVCLLAQWAMTRWLESDPHYAEVIMFVKSDQQVIQQVGTVASTKLVSLTTVRSSISVDDEFTPGYDLYRVDVKGERASVRVTVERTSLQDTRGNRLRIKSID